MREKKMADWFTTQQVADHTKYTIRKILDLARDGWFPGAINLDDSENARFPTLDPVDPKKQVDNSNNNGENPEIKKSADQKIIIENTLAAEKSRQELEAVKAGFIDAVEYKAAIDKISQDKLDFENYKALENSKIEQDKTANIEEKNRLKRVYDEIVQREKTVTTREDNCKIRETRLNDVEKLELQAKEQATTKVARLKDGLNFILNRISKINRDLKSPYINRCIDDIDKITAKDTENITDENCDLIMDKLAKLTDYTYECIISVWQSKDKTIAPLRHVITDVFDDIKGNAVKKITPHDLMEFIKPKRLIIEEIIIEKRGDNNV
jgi:hypothetical protein